MREELAKWKRDGRFVVMSPKNKGEPWAHTSITNEIIVTTRDLGFQTMDSKGKPRYPARSPWANQLGQAWISIESSGLGGQFRAGCFHRPHIQIKQSVALVFVLLPQLDDLLEDFHIKTLSLGL